jgi:hypothetical protein
MGFAMSVENRITACKLFVARMCPRQEAMESYYLVANFLDPVKVIECESFCISCSQKLPERREYERMPVSFLVSCKESDVLKLAGLAYNMSCGGIAIKTNFPISKGNTLEIEFTVPDVAEHLLVSAEVAWSHFHLDEPEREHTLFSAGIKFVDACAACGVYDLKCVQKSKENEPN